MLTKFGLLIDIDLLKTATSTNRNPEVVLSGGARHLEEWIWRHISADERGSLMQNNMKIETGSRIPI